MYGNFHRAEIVSGRPLSLFNLDEDISESNDLANQYPEIVNDLLHEAEKARKELGDFGLNGDGVRSAAIVENPIVQLKN
jgi:arylsulfatase